jgi:hypothetical protein
MIACLARISRLACDATKSPHMTLQSKPHAAGYSPKISAIKAVRETFVTGTPKGTLSYAKDFVEKWLPELNTPMLPGPLPPQSPLPLTAYPEDQS